MGEVNVAGALDGLGAVGREGVDGRFSIDDLQHGLRCGGRLGYLHDLRSDLG